MNEEISKRIAENEKKFGILQGKIDKIERMEREMLQQKSDLNIEVFRLQGEHRVLKSLLHPPKEEPLQPVVLD